MKYDIHLARIYAPATKNDGARILVDRLWPRGKRKEELHLTQWYRTASPPASLRKDWHSGAIDEETFTRRYYELLMSDTDVLLPLIEYIRKGRVTLLTASQDPRHSHLPVLQRALLDVLKSDDKPRQTDPGPDRKK